MWLEHHVGHAIVCTRIILYVSYILTLSSILVDEYSLYSQQEDTIRKRVQWMNMIKTLCFCYIGLRKIKCLVTASDIVRYGYTSSYIVRYGYTSSYIIGYGYTSSDIVRQGYTSSDIARQEYTASDIVRQGYTASDILSQKLKPSDTLPQILCNRSQTIG